MARYSYVSAILDVHTILLTRSRQTRGRRGGVKFANVSSDEEGDGQISTLRRINSDYFCQVLKHQLFAKVNLNFVKGVGLVSLPPPAPLERFLSPGQKPFSMKFEQPGDLQW